MEKKNRYPYIHFTPLKGWLNDPNGLVWHDGIYELYYQCNEETLQWSNVHWGHARSRDLLHWEHCGDVMLPDEYGLIFSGSGITGREGDAGLPKGSLLFPYTAAGRNEQGAHFTIRLAASTDGGNTLQKFPGTILQELAPDNRDPKVLWHEESGAYVLVLWIREDEFGIFRSKDMKWFELSSTVRLEGGFECPDLFRLPVLDEDGKASGESKWVFWAADGSYYAGDFDGFSFSGTQRRMRSGLSRLSYAAQTWADEPKGRVLSIAWLRTHSVADLYTGAMSLPHELSLVRRGGYLLLRQTLPEEIPAGEPLSEEKAGSGVFRLPSDGALRIKIRKPEAFGITLFGEGDEKLCGFSYRPEEKCLAVRYREAAEYLNQHAPEIHDVDLVYDRGITEVHINDGMQYAVTDLPWLRGSAVTKLLFDGGADSFFAGLIR